MTTLLLVLDEMAGTALIGVFIIAIAVAAASALEYLLRRFTTSPRVFDWCMRVTAGVAMGAIFMGILLIGAGMFVVPLEHVLPSDANGNTTATFVRLTGLVGSIHALLVSKGMSQSLAWLWTTVAGIVTVTSTVISGIKSYTYIKRWYTKRSHKPTATPHSTDRADA